MSPSLFILQAPSIIGIHGTNIDDGGLIFTEGTNTSEADKIFIYYRVFINFSLFVCYSQAIVLMIVFSPINFSDPGHISP